MKVTKLESNQFIYDNKILTVEDCEWRYRNRNESLRIVTAEKILIVSEIENSCEDLFPERIMIDMEEVCSGGLSGCVDGLPVEVTWKPYGKPGSVKLTRAKLMEIPRYHVKENLSSTDMLTTEQAAEYCGVSERTVREWNKRGYLPSTTRKGKSLYFKRGDLDKEMETRKKT